jgi:glutamine amidotransferase
MTRIAIVDYGLGNLFNVERALTASGAEAIITSDVNEIDSANAVVLPGVGAFGEGMQNLEARGLTQVVKAQAAEGKPVLGICLGMQLLFDESEEFGTWPGLGLIPGRVVPFAATTPAVKIPQIGWNSIEPRDGASWDETILDGIQPGSHLYFVHSYCVVTEDSMATLAETEYSGIRFAAVALRGNVVGCQFHPEKSSEAGLRLLRNFVERVRA